MTLFFNSVIPLFNSMTSRDMSADISSRGALVQIGRRAAYVLSGLLLSALSARAEAPSPSQEFWNYFVEFGDAQGAVFDPSDYAAVANIPAKAHQEINKAQQETNKAQQEINKTQPETDKSLHEINKAPRAGDTSAAQEQPR